MLMIMPRIKWMPWLLVLGLLGCTPKPTEQAASFRHKVLEDLSELRRDMAAMLPEVQSEELSPLLEGFFTEVPDRSHLYAGLVVFNPKGRVLCAYSPHEEAARRIKGHDFSNYDAVKKTLNKHVPSTMITYYLMHGQSRTLAVVNLPLSRSGAFVGIVSAFFWERILERDAEVTLEQFQELDFRSTPSRS